MLLYELLILDRTDPVFNPLWRQDYYTLPFASRLGALTSSYGWTEGLIKVNSIWTYEMVLFSHLLLSGLMHTSQSVFTHAI